MTKVIRTQEEIQELFKEWGRLFRGAAERYDRGDRAEAKNLATRLRVLLQDGTGQCLLTQLGKKRILFFNTPASGLACKLVRDEAGGFATVATESSPARQEVVAHTYPVYDNFDHGTWTRVKFSKWWKDAVLTAGAKLALSRENLVLTMANADGGAHIDRSVDAAYASVVRQEDWKVTLRMGDVSASPKYGRQYPAVRQIAYEVQKTLDAELSSLLEQPLTFPPPLARDPMLRMPSSTPHVKIGYEPGYLESILRDLEKSGEGESEEAQEIRRQLYWET